eukprot:CAMPEP_0172494066 /NCGR_PEP_ID=MMETSP1066-20121228/37917_1 /TAXON_ID=671091 /ORGANISM="Coscinodiscus wailesii, Strain CCMP2513" /LENGTH=721 /DNA_ID=CAMNT_0013264721 /DNA_START=150 /DNA_END=2315 /DNA_ORIENTATION=-
MKLHSSALVLLVTSSVVNAFIPRSLTTSRRSLTFNPSSTVVSVAEETGSAVLETVNYENVNKLSFRELQRECKARGLGAVGNTAVLRRRLLETVGASVEGEVNGVEEVDEQITPTGISFTDNSDPDFEYKSLLSQIESKSEMGHWKAATRKLKQLSRRFPTYPIPRETYLRVLETCADDRLHGARASIPARKVMEQMSEAGHSIPEALANKCITNCIGIEEGGKHDGCGGIDVALAMMATLDGGDDIVSLETYETVATALARDKSIDEAVALLRLTIAERGFTPQLSALADVAIAAANTRTHPESVLQILSLAKAAGYVLDGIASAAAGRDVLASGVVAAEQLDNLALGLRLLTAAGKAEGCAPDRGDFLVAANSASAQRACVLIHKRAVDKASIDGNWKLCVKLLELMTQRGLTPSAHVWRTVVTICAKCEKSRRATAILFDWVKISEEGKVQKPPLNVFNTVLNVCEICGEEELTLQVVEAMKKTHQNDGNVITFNIALKRLAKLGQKRACEGIIVAMIDSGVEPSVVSYTTAIGACAREEARDSALAYEWLQRMKLMGTSPNLYTYNTALAACLDGTLESTVRGSKIATEMLDAIYAEVAKGTKGNSKLTSVIPDTYTRTLSRNLMKQLRDNWRNGDINMMVAKATVRVPLLKLVDFSRSVAAESIAKEMEKAKQVRETATAVDEDEDVTDVVKKEEFEIEYAAVNSLHKSGRRNVEV